jgi:hypothetical protein
VLNAGATIGAVARDPGNRDRYLIRAELFEFLSVVAKKAFEGDKDMVKLAKLERDITVALQPDVDRNAEVVQDNLQPISFNDGDSAKIELHDGQTADDARVLRKFLNAGAMHKKVRNDKDNSKAFFVHSDLVRTLSSIQARAMSSGSYQPQLAGPRAASSSLNGGDLTAKRPQIAGASAALQQQLAGPGGPRAVAAVSGPAVAKASVSDSPFPNTIRPGLKVAAARAPATLEELRSEYYSDMLEAISLDASKFAHLTSPAVGELAKSAGERLSRLARRHTEIRRQMDLREGDIQARLTGAYNRIWTTLADDAAKIQVLNEVQETIVHFLPALTLRDMLSDLIVGLERPAARDDGIFDLEQKLLDQLREIRSMLDGMDLANEQAWQRLGQNLGRMIEPQDLATAVVQPLAAKRALN